MAVARFFLIVLSVGYMCPSNAGVALGATRVVYPAGEKQVQLIVSNSDEKSSFLIQSWVENEKGDKDGNFIITPPLFTMQGKKENKLRIIDTMNKTLPTDKESIYWINVKAIPSIDKDKLNTNVLQLSIISRIKLLYRPQNLAVSPEMAIKMISFQADRSRLLVKNNSPYYLTIVNLKIGKYPLKGVMVPPMDSIGVSLPSGAGNKLSYQTINDYGALTPKVMVNI